VIDMLGVINTRADLDALRGTDFYGQALRTFLGATTMWANDAPAGESPQWRQVSVGDTLARLDLTLDELLAECAVAGIVPQPPEAPVTAPALPAATLPLLSRRQLIMGMLSAGLINTVEAIAAGAGGVPATIQAVLDQIPDPTARALETVRWQAMEVAKRDHPLTLMIQAAAGKTDAEVDALWLAWAAL
jgi:hypothetical protein